MIAKSETRNEDQSPLSFDQERERERAILEKIAHELGYAERFQRIIDAETWPPHRTVEELNQIIPQIREASQGLMDSLRPLKTSDQPWAWHQAFGKAPLTSGFAVLIFDLVCGKGRKYGDKGPDSDDSRACAFAEMAAADAVGWEALAEKPLAINPYEAEFRLFELGAANWHFYLVDGEEKLVVDFPLGGEHEGLVACLAFGDNEPGDQEVLYVHDLLEFCSKNRLIGYLRREIQTGPAPD